MRPSCLECTVPTREHAPRPLPRHPVRARAHNRGAPSHKEAHKEAHTRTSGIDAVLIAPSGNGCTACSPPCPPRTCMRHTPGRAPLAAGEVLQPLLPRHPPPQPQLDVLPLLRLPPPPPHPPPPPPTATATTTATTAATSTSRCSPSRRHPPPRRPPLPPAARRCPRHPCARAPRGPQPNIAQLGDTSTKLHCSLVTRRQSCTAAW